MGHRFSKGFAPTSLSGSKSSQRAGKKQQQLQQQGNNAHEHKQSGSGCQQQQQLSPQLSSLAIDIQQQQQQHHRHQQVVLTPAPLNLAQSNNSLSTSHSLSNNSIGSQNSCPTKIIITIELSSKMDNGNETIETPVGAAAAAAGAAAATAAIFMPAADVNSNSCQPATAGSSELAKSASCSSKSRHSSQQQNEAASHGYKSIRDYESETVEYSEIFERKTSASTCSIKQMETDSRNEQISFSNEDEDNDSSLNNSSCCRRKSKSSSNSKRRCGKCTCREVIRRFMEPSSSAKQRKACGKLQQQNSPKIVPHAGRMPTSVPSAMPASTASIRSHAAATSSSSENSAVNSSPQIVVVQCSSPLNDALLRRLANEIVETTTASTINNNNNGLMNVVASTAAASPSNSSRIAMSNNNSTPKVHSQVDYVHYLVPDLDKIFNSTYYWGKMDRYQAESLLESKPEGTFLLRDSAQEEFLFSVTFRKYGRSLHARIEQSEHSFSFDCHDTCVFRDSTVTGLLEHYKDPSSVMFFEPMLTIPLHRKTTFSLQELSRSVIVSNTSYDGINNLELPSRLKAYLKEYHYKHKLRTKRADDSYSCT